MDVSAATPFHTDSRTPDSARLAIALAVALGVHAVLIVIPISPVPRIPDAPVENYLPLEIRLVPSANTEASKEPETKALSTPKKSHNSENSNTVEAEQTPTIATPDTEVQRDLKAIPVPAETAASHSTTKPNPENHSNTLLKSADQPTDFGAQSRSTIFDPKLRKKLAHERNKIQKFHASDAAYMTATGKFVQQGDRCWDVVKLAPGDEIGGSDQWFRRKCPMNISRPPSDIDRLAEKYGLP